jgi:hypothetical protein
MPFGFRRRDPDTDYGPGSNWWEDADAQHALNDYGAAVSSMPPEERPPFLLDDWRTEDSQPTTPDWARDDQADPFPGEPPGRVWEPPADGHRYPSPCPDPHCRGECGG